MLEAKVIYWISWTDLDGRYKRKFDNAQARNAQYNQLIANNKQMKQDDEFFASNVRIWQETIKPAMNIGLVGKAINQQNNTSFRGRKQN